jgi:formate dehydrogenase maturation protein FdhE
VAYVLSNGQATQAVERERRRAEKRQDCPHCGPRAVTTLLQGRGRRYLCGLCARVFYVPAGL